MANSITDKSTGVYRPAKNYAKENKERFDKIKAEPKLKIYGNPLFAQYFGHVYSFNYQDYPVTIKFDGTYQEYHETIANLILEKLNKAALTNAAKEMGDGDKL